MRKTYTALALMFAVATAWAQAPLSEAMMPGNQLGTRLGRHAAGMVELQTVGNGSASHARRAEATLPTVADLITEQPQGTLYKAMYRTSNAYYQDNYGNVKESTADGYSTDVVVSTDGKKIYVKNPFINLNTGTWLVGNLDADGNVEFNFPQAIYHMTSSAGETLGYAWKMTQTATDQGTAVAKDASSQTVKFTWADNTLTQVNYDEVIGLGNETGGWYGYGIYGSTFAQQKDVVMKPADETKAENWRLSYTSAVNGDARKQNVKVVIDGQRVYVGGIYSDDYWMMGLISGKNVVFPSQYLGYSESSSTYDYMAPLEFATVNNKTVVYPMDNITFTYDAAAKKMSTDFAIGVNVGKYEVQLKEAYQKPVIENVVYTVGKPAKPVIDYVMPFNSDKDQPDMGGVSYVLSNLDENGKELNEENIYYNLYLDDQLVTFDKATYKYIEQDMTNLPYGYTDKYYDSWKRVYGWDLYTLTSNGVLFQDVYFYKNFSKVGLKALYIDGDKTYESDLTEYTVAGISNAGIDEGANVKSVSYSDLSGRKVAAPVHGVYLQTVKYDNGQTKTVKVAK